MINKKEKQELINKLAHNEALISELYGMYSQQFQNKKFWKDLSEEEILHYEWIQSFSKYSDDFKIEIDNFRISAPKIEECISTAKHMIFNATETSLEQALKNALLIESDLVEENYFSAFKSTRSSIEELLRQLESDTHRHINIIKQELNAKR